MNGLDQISEDLRGRCTKCLAPHDEDHRPGCDAVLARCGECYAPIITVSDRPPEGTAIVKCRRGHEVTIPSSLTRRA